MNEPETAHECCCDDTDDDGPTFERTKLRQARKTHVCGECGDMINPGERYEITCGVWDGEWHEHKTCIPCVGIRSDFFRCGWHFGQMRESFRDCYGFDYASIVERQLSALDRHERALAGEKV